MAAYATQEEFEAYVVGWTTDDPAALGKMLEQASADLDQILGDYDLNEDGDFAGLKLDREELDYTEDRAISRACCAQTEYRFHMGEEFFIRPQFSSTTGPEFSTSGRPPTVAPKAMRELAGTGLLRNTVALGGARRQPSWLGFARNISDPYDRDY